MLVPEFHPFFFSLIISDFNLWLVKFSELLTSVFASFNSKHFCFCKIYLSLICLWIYDLYSIQYTVVREWLADSFSPFEAIHCWEFQPWTTKCASRAFPGLSQNLRRLELFPRQTWMECRRWRTTSSRPKDRRCRNIDSRQRHLLEKIVARTLDDQRYPMPLG